MLGRLRRAERLFRRRGPRQEFRCAEGWSAAGRRRPVVTNTAAVEGEGSPSVDFDPQDAGNDDPFAARFQSMGEAEVW